MYILFISREVSSQKILEGGLAKFNCIPGSEQGANPFQVPEKLTKHKENIQTLHTEVQM